LAIEPAGESGRGRSGILYQCHPRPSADAGACEYQKA
jgi:hypothetical protein